MTSVHRPLRPAEAVEVLADVHARGEAALVVGGGTIVLPRLGRGELRADHLVDLWEAGLGRVERHPGMLRIGAQVTYQQLLEDPVVRDTVPIVTLMCAGITGGVQVRSQGTLAGSACAARPYSDLPSVLCALGAHLLIRGTGGVRSVAYGDFVRDAEQTFLAPTEVVEAIDVPLPDRAHLAGHRKIKTAEGSWPIVTVSAIRTDRRVVVGIGGVLRRPVRLDVTFDDPAECIDATLDGLATALGAPEAPEPWGDVLAPAWYRRRVVPAVLRGVLETLADGRHAHPKEELWHR